MVNTAKILVHPNEIWNKNFLLAFRHRLLTFSLGFSVSDIDYRQFFAFGVNYRYRFVYAFKQHRLPT